MKSRKLLTIAAAAALLSMLALEPAMGFQLTPVTGGASVGLESGVPPSLLRNGPVGELLAVYTPRNRDEIQRLLSVARSEREIAENEIAESRGFADAADGRVRIMNEEVKTTQTRLSVVKKEKNTSDRTTLDVELKRQKAELKYIERVRDAKRADLARLDSESSAASARIGALELESDVARKYDEIVVAGTDSTTGIASYRDVLKRMFTARGEAADRGADAASKAKAVATVRLKQLDALSKLSN